MAAKGRDMPLLDASSSTGVGDRLRGKDPSAALRVNSGGGGVSAGSCHGEARIARAGWYGEGGDVRGVCRRAFGQAGRGGRARLASGQGRSLRVGDLVCDCRAGELNIYLVVDQDRKNIITVAHRLRRHRTN